MKTVKERDDFDLLELVCQLHSRAIRVNTKEMHDAYVEARKEMEDRIKHKNLTIENQNRKIDESIEIFKTIEQKIKNTQLGH